MDKVDFTFKRAGHTRVMSKRQAAILAKLGHGDYLTRDMAQQPSVQQPMQAGDGLDDLDREALHALAKDRGLTVHHASGADKVRAVLRENAA